MAIGKKICKLLTWRTERRGIYYVTLTIGLICYTSVWFQHHTLNATTGGDETVARLLGGFLPSEATPSATRILRMLLEQQPATDKSPKLSEDDMVALIQNKMPNLPIEFWTKHKWPRLAKNRTCARFPTPFEINYENIYWQTMTTSNGSFHLLSAYYDNRTLLANVPAIRILGMINRIKPAVKTHCQFWFEGLKKPVFSPVSQYNYIWIKEWGNYHQGFYQPYLISCNITAESKHLVPVAVSLVEKPCDMATNSLKVINNQPPSGKKEDFAVCVKGIDFRRADISVKLVEWLELLFILGANKVFMYDLEMHPNVTKVLNYYEKKGLVEVTKLTLPGTEPNVPDLLHMFLKAKIVHKRQNEVIPYNDCLYKNMNRYKYISLLDTDEVIMPISAQNWTELMKIVIQKAVGTRIRSSYVARHVYFLDVVQEMQGRVSGIPKYMQMMRSVYRSTNFTKPGHYIKAFHNTERVMTLHNHFPFSCLDGCYANSMSTEDAHMQHYRRECVGELKTSCNNDFKKYVTLDTSIWRYREPVIKSVTHTLKHLGFIHYEANSDLPLPSAASVK